MLDTDIPNLDLTVIGIDVNRLARKFPMDDVVLVQVLQSIENFLAPATYDVDSQRRIDLL